MGLFWKHLTHLQYQYVQPCRKRQHGPGGPLAVTQLLVCMGVLGKGRLLGVDGAWWHGQSEDF